MYKNEDYPDITGKNWTDRDERGRLLSGHQGMGGRPKGSLSLIPYLKQKLQEVPLGQLQTAGELIIDNIVRGGMAGDLKLMKMILDYVEGPPRTKVDLNIEGRENLTELTEFFRNIANRHKKEETLV